MLQEPPEGPEGTEPDAAPTRFQTLHASLQNVSLPAVAINGGNGTVVAPRVVRPATLQVPDVDGGGMGAEVNTDQGDTTSENDEGVSSGKFTFFSYARLLAGSMNHR